MEKVQLILQLLHPYTFIPTSTVIREMRVLEKCGAKGISMHFAIYSRFLGKMEINLATKIIKFGILRTLIPYPHQLTPNDPLLMDIAHKIDFEQ